MGTYKNKKFRLAPLFIAVAVVLAYLNSFSGAFVLDDSGRIVENTRIRSLWPRTGTTWPGWRCIPEMTFAINYATGKLNPADYHATNLLIHLVAALLLYGVVRRTLMLPVMSGWFRSRAAQIAFFSSAIWTVHPLTTSSVTYICQRYESLMGMFYLLTLYCVIRGAASNVRRSGWYVAAVVACMSGMATKEVMITAPVVVLVYDRIFLASSFREVLSRRRGLYAGLAATWVFLGFLMVSAVPESESVIYAYGGGPSISYLLTQCRVISHYLRLSFWPYPLCLDYAWPLVERARDAFPSLMFMCALGLATLWALRYSPPAGFIGLWFFAVLSPTSSFLSIPDAAFEQRMYLPLAAVVTGAVAGTYNLVNRLSRKGLMLRLSSDLLTTGIWVVVMIALVCATHFRNRIYCSEELIWRDVIAQRPDNLRAYQNLATALYSNGRHQEAIECCVEMLNRLPDLKNVEHAEVLRRESEPGGDKLFQQVFNYAGAHNTIGLALYAQGRLEESMEHFAESVRLAPGNYRARSNLASTLFQLGRTDEAVMNWRQALRIMPGDANTHRSLAEALLSLGNVAGAVERYNTALRLEPDDVRTQTCLAWILATSSDGGLRNGRRAVELAENAAKAVDYKSARVLDVLSAAYAEAGQFEKAARTARRAIRLVKEDSDRIDIEKRLELYLNGNRCRRMDGFVPVGSNE